MKRTTLAYSSQDHSPLHTFMLSWEKGQNFMKSSPWVFVKLFFQPSHQEKIVEQTWFRSCSQKYLNDHPVSIGLTFSGLIGLPTVNKYLIPYRMGELSYVYFYPFSGTGDYQRKRAPTGVFFVLLDSLKLKSPSSIYFLELAKNPQDTTTTVSLDTHR